MSGTDLLAKYVAASPETQAQIAARCKVSQAYLSLLVAGKRTVLLLDVAARIEEATGGKVPASSWLGAKRVVRSAAGSRARKSSNRTA
jgi:transcriptional regulator with XRE-family HTH domain